MLSSRSLRTLLPAASEAASEQPADGSAATAGIAGSLPAKRKHTRQACMPCRRLKTKCDGRKPLCYNCATRNQSCTYEERLKINEPTVKHPVVLPIAAPYAHPLVDVNTTRAAIDSFYNCSGKLFHVLSRQQTEQAFANIVEHQGSPYEAHQSDVCCIMAVAAVGAQYVNCQEDDKHQEETFYEAAKRYFDYVVENRPFIAVKICVLLAMFNVFGKSMVALAYIDIGLGMSRRFGLDSGQCRQRNLSRATWIDYRKTWRTLTFLSTWLSSTLGYLTANDVSCIDASSLDTDVSETQDMSEVIQTALSRIAVLKVRILTIQMPFKDIALLTTHSVVQDLQRWYDNLPQELHIERMGDVELPLESRRSLYHVHLLYLGAIMLLYRRIATQHLHLQEMETCPTVLPSLNPAHVAEHGERGLLAAISSARILKLALDEGGIFKRCWLVIFQSFISSVVILHAAAQQKLHHFGESHWRATLEYAEICIEILAFCGTADHIATRFHEQLKIIYGSLIEDQPITNNDDTPMDGDHRAVNQASVVAEAAETLLPGDAPYSNDGYLLSFPPSTTPAQRQLSLNLLGMLCRPYGDPTQEPQSETALKARWGGETPRDEDVRMIERDHWGFERKPFRWDTATLGPGSAFLSREDSSSSSASRTIEDGGTGSDSNNTPAGSRDPTGSSWLLGSSSPSGWTPADALRPA